MKPARHESALTAMLAAAVLWAIGQIAWRYGEGSALSLAGQRALVGALFLAPVIRRGGRAGTFKAMLSHRWAMAGIIASGVSMPFTATLFRELTGPQAALLTAITPGIILLCEGVVRRRTSPTVAAVVLLSSAFACAAAFYGGLGHFATAGLIAAVALIITNVITLFSLEVARKQFDASTLIAAGMIAATVGCYALALVTQSWTNIIASGLIAATVCGVVGTAARVLRAQALPNLGSSVAASTSQLTALLTAIGGVLLFSDSFTLTALLLGALAGGLSVIAVIMANRTVTPNE